MFSSPELEIYKARNHEQATSNYLYINPALYQKFAKQNAGREPIYAKLKHSVFILAEDPKTPETGVSISGITRSNLKLSQVMDKPKLQLYRLPDKGNFMISSMEVIVKSPTLQDVFEVSEADLGSLLKQKYTRHLLSIGQEVFNTFKSCDLVFRVKNITWADEEGSKFQIGMIFEETQIEIKSKTKSLRVKSSSLKSKSIFSKNFRFENLGVGGLDKQIMKIFRMAFSTRRLPISVLEKYGKDHIKGILLYGPPGTGKTLIARGLAKCLDSTEPVLVNGPELLSKFVGESEENVRKLFLPAKKDQDELGDDSPLHVIIFDEFDALAKPRGSSGDNTGVASNVVNQLLSMIDGVDALNNVLLIGMTNRIDLIDKAILRPGRFSVHVEISLPDAEGRHQILQIHTKEMRENKLLASDVDMEELSRLTKNYTGAELRDVVKSANSFALNSKHDLMDFNKELDFSDLAQVTMADFINALEEVKPDFGVDTDKIEVRLRGSVVDYGTRFEELMTNLKDSLEGFKKSSISVSSVLLYGEPGTGKTTLACHLAKESEIAYAKLISSEDLISLMEHGKIAKIVDIFSNAYRTPMSLIILDDIER